jgi:hypothetical protein
MIDVNYSIINLGNRINGEYQYTIIQRLVDDEISIYSRDIDEYKNKYNSNICNVLYDIYPDHDLKINCSNYKN